MATKISSDISTNVDITSRKLDSFFLTAQVDNLDGTRFDLTSYTTMEFIVTNSNNTIVKKFQKSGSLATTTEVLKPSSITDSAALGVITINVPATTVVESGGNAGTYNNMNIQVGSYNYTLKITSSTETHTILHGKYKIVG
jgi:hypothetical protein|tara:strand:- start:1410 stop:1832 length:423 start_codon:yes stop_codon:yes gene_type:complete